LVTSRIALAVATNANVHLYCFHELSPQFDDSGRLASVMQQPSACEESVRAMSARDV
jgi:hypothetical protein